MNRLALAFRIALAELRGGTKGFRLFLACLAIGVAAISAAGSTASAFREGLASEQRAILGGDLMFDVEQRFPSDAEQAFFAKRGITSLNVGTRTMGEVGQTRRLVEVRAVSKLHPLEGTIDLQPSQPLQGLLVNRDGVWGAAAEKGVMDAFGLKVGDRLQLPYGVVEIRAVILKESDTLGRGFTFAPRIIISRDATQSFKLAEPGSIFDATLRIKLNPGQDAKQVQKDFAVAFPDEARNLRDVSRTANGLDRLLERLDLFLSCVGFAALLAGGLGVRGAVAGHMETRRGSIAVLKTLGASGADIRMAYGIQIAVLAGLGSLIGVVIGAMAPFIAATAYGDALPIPIRLALYPGPLFSALGIGLLAAAAFAIMPLGAARATPPTHLFRGGLGLESVPWTERLAALLALIALAAIFALTSPDPMMAAGLAAGSALAWGLFWLLGRVSQIAARRLQPHTSGIVGLALAGLGGPGSLAPAALPALGLGLALLALLGQVQSNLVAQVRETAPANAPSVAFLEIPSDKADRFDAIINQAIGTQTATTYGRTPVMTLRVQALNGTPFDPSKVNPSERWFTESEISATYLGAKPGNAEVVEGQWWSADYRGPTQVSLEVDAAKGSGIKIGDTVTFIVLGQPVSAEVVNFRKVDWSGFGATFAVIFSPGALDAAALRSIAIARFSPEQEAKVTRAIAAEFPAVGVVRIRDALTAATALFESLALAVQAIAAVAVAAGAAAVAGALAAGARRRLYEAAILKTLGATRGQILSAFALEQGLAGLAAATLGAGLGLGAAYWIVERTLEAKWILNLPLAGSILGGAIVAFTIAGLIAGRAALGRPPMRVLAAAAEFK